MKRFCDRRLDGKADALRRPKAPVGRFPWCRFSLFNHTTSPQAASSTDLCSCNPLSVQVEKRVEELIKSSAVIDNNGVRTEKTMTEATVCQGFGVCPWQGQSSETGAYIRPGGMHGGWQAQVALVPTVPAGR